MTERTAKEWGRLAMRIPGWLAPVEYQTGSYMPCLPLSVPDPDHWMWEGWFLRLLGPCEVAYDDTDPEIGPWSVEVPGVFRMGPSIGRAAIAAAEAIGRWPGGEG